MAETVATFGSFKAVISSLHFRPYYLPGLKSNIVAYFAHSVTLIR